MTSDDGEAPKPRLSWREGLYLVGPHPLTTPYYVSGFLLAAGVGYATPLVQIGLYLLLLLLAPLYIEAVLLTLSNGGSYVMTRYALSQFGRYALLAAALVGVIVSLSYAATAIASMLMFGTYMGELARALIGRGTLPVLVLAAVPATVFGVWLDPKAWRATLWSVGAASVAGLVLAPTLSAPVVATFAPLAVLVQVNNLGLKQSVRVGKAVFLLNLGVVGLTIVAGLVCLALQGVDLHPIVHGAGAPVGADPALWHGRGFLPGLALIGAPLLLAGVGNAILGASGVESVMNIPEELENPQRDVPKIYWAMLLTLLVVGGSLALLVFLLLPPQVLLNHPFDLLGQLGRHIGIGLTGSTTVGEVWRTVITINAALMLIGATNTGFAGARGLWLAMSRDDLLPRSLLGANQAGAFPRMHWMMIGACLLLATQADWQVHTLERWYWAMFGLVLLSGLVAFALLRRFKADDRRVYSAPWNLTVLQVRLPVALIVGAMALSYAMLEMWTGSPASMGELRLLFTTVVVLVGAVVLVHNHRPLIRGGYRYFRRVLETVESTVIDPQQRTIVVAVGGVRVGRLITKAIDLARQQGRTTGIPYRQVVVFHMTRSVRSEFMYRVTRDDIRPEGIEGNVTRIFTELTEIVPDDMDLYLALVPDKSGKQTLQRGPLHAALDALVAFHEQHSFKGHIIMIGTYGVKQADIDELHARLKGTILVPVPLFDD
ncbi:MAG: amino acid permease [Myxococcales bacterium]|nr:amino acid permease [Myxococcales bacterium]